jgi:hypothetical protein
MKKLILLFVIVSGLMAASCYKEPERGITKITTNYQNFHQPGVDVHLYGPSGSQIDHHLLTDQNGQVVYEHDPALEVILNAYCSFTDGTGFHYCSGIVRITPDKTTDYTFNLN